MQARAMRKFGCCIGVCQCRIGTARRLATAHFCRVWLEAGWRSPVDGQRRQWADGGSWSVQAPARPGTRPGWAGAWQRRGNRRRPPGLGRVTPFARGLFGSAGGGARPIRSAGPALRHSLARARRRGGPVAPDGCDRERPDRIRAPRQGGPRRAGRRNGPGGALQAAVRRGRPGARADRAAAGVAGADRRDRAGGPALRSGPGAVPPGPGSAAAGGCSKSSSSAP